MRTWDAPLILRAKVAIFFFYGNGWAAEMLRRICFAKQMKRLDNFLCPISEKNYNFAVESKKNSVVI